MSVRVVVIGAGVAGVAAAWSAARRGADIALVDGGAGSSMWAAGAVDELPWEQVARASDVGRRLGARRPAARLEPSELGCRRLERDVASFVEALGVWVVGDEPALLATVAGRVRPARGRDAALLDLAGLGSGTVLLPRVDRAGWDAESLARALSSEPAARTAGLAFAAIDATVLLRTDELRIADIDLAARHDEEERVGWLATHLRRAVGRTADARGVLLGPWLGRAKPRAAALSARVGLPVGEALIGVGGPAGLRLRAALDGVVRGTAAAVERRRATHVGLDSSRRLPNSDGLLVTLDGGDVLEADAVILAIGGLAGGGLTYRPPDHEAADDLPPVVSPAFTTSVAICAEVGAELAAFGRPIDVGSSLHGPVLDATAWPNADTAGVLEAVGLRADADLARHGLYAAGDVVADRPRTFLHAVASGIRAGIAAAG